VDLRRHFEVLSRFRVLIAVSVIVGLLLATLAMFRVSSSGIAWRHSPVYRSDSVLLVTQLGFPEGRALLQTAPTDGTTPLPGDKSSPPTDSTFADPSRFSGLASIYSFLVKSQEVRALIPGRPQESDIAAQPFSENGGGSGGTLPLIGLSTFANDAGRAQKLNQQTIDALLKYLRSQQSRTDTPQAQRARITVLNPPAKATVAQGRSKTKAIVIFLLCIIGGVALAYLLENLRPVDPLPRLDGPRGRLDDEPVQSLHRDEGPMKLPVGISPSPRPEA
jgi:hypothetical protein